MLTNVEYNIEKVIATLLIIYKIKLFKVIKSKILSIIDNQVISEPIIYSNK